MPALPLLPTGRHSLPVPVSYACLAIGAFGLGLTEFATMGLMPQFAADLGVSITEAGHAVSAYALGVVVGAPLITALTSRVPRKPLLLAMVCLFILGNLLVATSPSMSMLLIARVVSGLPHGVYLGVAGIVAARLTRPERSGTAVARVMLGMTIANIVGVPAATVLGAQLGWRTSYFVFAAVGVVNFLAVALFVPAVGATGTNTATGDPAPAQRPSTRAELRTLARPQVVLTLLAGSLGFGGMFAVYTYIAPTVTDLAGAADSVVPWVLVAYGVGMTLGSLIAGPLIDKSIERAVIIGVAGLGIVLAAFGTLAHLFPAIVVCMVLLGIGGSIFTTGLQVRLMRETHDAPSMSAAMNQSAFNLANALGAFLGGVVIDAGLGYRAPAFTGVGLTAIGFCFILAAVIGYRRRRTRARDVVPV
ncbi:MFS transporter [Brevibacterium sp. 50QC2O2]|uniref:MFS transporter n=1 Tax=Brevibacterium TaxID=1696 RepID=UPI00211BC4B6|nr:MFS transporter [Brevibacterium sp. 68QC2CO]MCQ9387662.1 MFS transporter [Brevibacterium sp. 50QC2O2]